MDDVSFTQRDLSSLVTLPRHQLSLTQVYAVAASVRSKLKKEADRPEYDLRRLVAHANILDSMEDLRGNVALDEPSDDVQREEEQALHLLEVETEASSRAVLSDSELVTDLEPDTCDPELTLVRSPTRSSNVAPTSRQSDHDPPAVHIPTSGLIQRLVIASILDDIEKELSDDDFDDDETVADGASTDLSDNHRSRQARPLFTQSRASPVAKTTANLVVSRPKPLKQRIPAAA